MEGAPSAAAVSAVDASVSAPVDAPVDAHGLRVSASAYELEDASDRGVSAAMTAQDRTAAPSSAADDEPPELVSSVESVSAEVRARRIAQAVEEHDYNAPANQLGAAPAARGSLEC